VVRTLADRKDKNQEIFDDFKPIGKIHIFFLAVPYTPGTMAHMADMNKKDIPGQLAALLQSSGLISKKEAEIFPRTADIRIVHGDGSCRRFFRIGRKGKNLCLAVAPAALEGNDLAEAKAAAYIGSHLLKNGVPVPSIYGWDEDSGLILFEDLGDSRLHDLKKQGSEEDLRPWYRSLQRRSTA
jgi:hypothetical protein